MNVPLRQPNEQVISRREGSRSPSPRAGPCLDGLLAKQSWLEKDQAHENRPEGQGQAPYYSRGHIIKTLIFFASMETFSRVTYRTVLCMGFGRDGAINGVNLRICWVR